MQPRGSPREGKSLTLVFSFGSVKMGKPKTLDLIGNLFEMHYDAPWSGLFQSSNETINKIVSKILSWTTHMKVLYLRQ